MKYSLRVCLLAAVAVILFGLPPNTSADDWNRLTTAVFNQPVQIPGNVLPAGIYVFKLADISGEHNVVQIWNADETELMATVMGFPQYVDTAPATNLFIFEEQGKERPALLKSWFHAGNPCGERFIYPEERRKDR